MKFALEVEALQISLSNHQVLMRDLNFKLKFGELLVFLGPNGVGKSTLAHTLVGLHGHFQGSIMRSFKKPGFLPQLASREFLLPLSLLDIIKIQNPSVKMDDILRVGLFAKPIDLTVAWNSASGGERQRASLTSLFLRGSDFLILDEPFNHLDQEAQTRVEAILAEKKRSGNAVVLISHDEFSQRLPDQVIQIRGVH